MVIGSSIDDYTHHVYDMPARCSYVELPPRDGTRMRFCRSFVVPLVALATLAQTAPAPASVMMRAEAEPERIKFPATKRIVYRLQIAAAGQDETFSLHALAPRFGRGKGGLPIEGSPIEPVIEPKLVSGAARFLGPRGGTLALPACSAAYNLFHGFEVDNRRWDMSVPVGTTSVLEFPYATGPFAPWPDTSFRLTFVADPRLIDGGRGTLTQRSTARSSRPTVTGRRGVHIRLRTSPATKPFMERPETVLGRGARFLVRGRTNPRLRRQRIDLKYIGPGPPRLRLLRSVLTDRRGHFRRSVRTPRRPGHYQLWAFYKSQRRDLASDHACPLAWRTR